MTAYSYDIIIIGGIVMRCGTKRYIVRAILDDEETEEVVPARSPADARKVYRAKYGRDTEILQVREM